MFKKIITVLVCIACITSISFSYGREDAGKKIEFGGTGRDVSGTNMASIAYTDSMMPAEGWEPQNFNSFVGESKGIKGETIKDLKNKLWDKVIPDGKRKVEYWDADTYFEYQYVDGSKFHDDFEISHYYLVDVDGVLLKPYGSLMDASQYPTPIIVDEKNAKSKSPDDDLMQGRVSMRDDISFKFEGTDKTYHITDPDVYIVLKIGLRPNEDLEPKGDLNEWFYGMYDVRFIQLCTPPVASVAVSDLGEDEELVDVYDGIKEMQKTMRINQTKLGSVTQLDYDDYPEFPWDYVLKDNAHLDIVKKQVASTINQTFYIHEGNLYGFGDDDSGFFDGFDGHDALRYNLGHGRYGTNANPILIDKNVLSVATTPYALFDTSLFYIKEDGSLWAMGSNEVGNLGDGSYVDRPRPVKILEDVVDVAASDFQTMALKKDGSLWIWGSTDYWYDINKVYEERRERPLPYRIMDDVKALDHKNKATLVLRSDNTMLAWGESFGEVDFGRIQNLAWDDYVMTLKNVKSIDAGQNVSSIITNDNKLWLIGDFDDEFLDGYYGNNEKLAPNVTFFMDGIKEADVEEYLVAYIKEDDSLWTWGYAGFTSMTQKIPYTGTASLLHKEPVKLLENVERMYRQNAHNFVARKDGSVWCWGLTSNGELRTKDPETPLLSDDYEVFPIMFKTQYITASKNNRTFDSLPVDLSILNPADGLPKEIIEGRCLDYTLKVDGVDYSAGLYQVNGEVFVNVRDIARVLTGSSKSFAIDWNEEKKQLKLNRGKVYESLGNDLLSADGYSREGTLYSTKLLVDEVEENLLTYSFFYRTYTRLKDIKEVFDFKISVDIDNRVIIINTK